MKKLVNELINPTNIFSQVQALQRECPIPRSPGVYAWVFKEIPPNIHLINV
jgi:hypothetical protein